MPEPAAVLGAITLLARDLEWSDLVAFYAAGLATFTFVNDWARRSFTARVSVERGFITAGSKLQDVFIVAATNHGERDVTLSGWGINLPNGKQMFFPRQQAVNFPFELKPGKKCQVFIDALEFSLEIKRLGFDGDQAFVGFFRDQLDKKFKSKKFTFNADEWLNQKK